MGIFKSIKKTITLKNEELMWDRVNSILSSVEIHSLEKICANGEHIYACVDNNDICILMMDAVTHDCEIADESIMEDYPPLYFSECSHRTSPVFRLHAICEALKRYSGFAKARISGILFTTSNILNLEDVRGVWDYLNIPVRCVKKMKYTIHHELTSEIWENVSAYLKTAYLEDYTTISQYNSILENMPTYENVEKKTEKSASSKRKRKELRLEDIIDKNDPIFHTVGGDGTSSFISASLPPIQVLPPMKNATAALEQMVGLEEIKSHITKLKNFVLFKKKLKEFPEIKCPQISLHSLFVGTPGTGKTSVALLYASILKEAGILSKGNLLLVNGRNGFMGKYVGAEEKNVRMALAAAKGNVLLIDEAYTLVSPNEMDYARNVLPMMLQLLADEEDRDIAVILCGYDTEMESLLSSNPGLRSRFPNIFHFEDYSLDELHKIAVKKIQQSGYKLSNEAEKKIAHVLQDMYENRVEEQWANGREASNLFDRILIAHANRCISSGAEDDMLITITAEDIPEARNKTGRKSRRIGFH